ncbi:hypothetical protein VTJ83DRAFT_5550 [Remersonia thermophila]|uniref:Deacetylase sirtuin-type domain-containing protein n=1 Tax=Remersonia thermophila TaxID=72144 RepID=A0ABR4D760_9PEZI
MRPSAAGLVTSPISRPLVRRTFLSFTAAMAPKNPKYNDVDAFHARLRRSRRILAVCGAGLSAASGLPTFRGAGGWWRNYEAMKLATPEAFARDPGLVWLFYAYRRHMALRVKPNAGHYALAELARQNPNFLCVSQNVDNLHPRAGHPPEQLRLLHGSLFTLKCESPTCDYSETNLDSPLCPALAPAAVDAPADPAVMHPLLDPSTPLPTPSRKDLPRCPRCRRSRAAASRQGEQDTGPLLRPGVVWFGEQLDPSVLSYVDAWIAGPAHPPVDMVLVVGTSGIVYPAAGLAELARSSCRRRSRRCHGDGGGGGGGPRRQAGRDGGAGREGAEAEAEKKEEEEEEETSIVHINLDAEAPETLRRLGPGDFAFAGDAAEVLPRLLEPVIGRWDKGEKRFVREDERTSS